MTRLPLEIWREVFGYACTDGGYTGASLALACKLFYNASLPVRSHALSLFSLRQVELFLAHAKGYEDRYHGRRLRIYHLLLSFPASPPSSPSDLSSDSSFGENSPAEQWITARRLREQDKAAWDCRFLKLVPRLLELAAPHLRTLALLQSDGFVLPAMKPVLPRLRELTLLVGISVIVNGDEVFDGGGRSSVSASPPSWSRSLPSPLSQTPISVTPSPPTTSSRFPVLERVHLICGRHRDFVLRDTLTHLPRLAPSLTHLRISNTTYTHEHCIPAFLRAAVGLPGPDPHHTPTALYAAESPVRAPFEEGDGGVRALLPALRHVLVHSVPPPSAGTAGGPYKEYMALTGALNAISAACEGTLDVRVRITRSARAKQRCWEQVVETHWLDRIEGGHGCWVGRFDCADGAARG
ncbi:hypothetical protein BC628DRAFT_1329076 [Trametes gibbosa]|nr:hypothetical protein BC628DRAFT_1329076 [Trametes gibbosa]